MNKEEYKHAVKNQPNKLGTAAIGKLLFEYSLPAVASMVLGSLYNVIDTIFLGQAYPDGSGVAITTIALPVMMLGLGFSMLPGQGGNALAAIVLGKGDKKTVEKILGNTCLLLIGLGVIIAIVGHFWMDPILAVIGTPENLVPGTKIFLQIQCYGFVCLSVGFGLNNFLRTAGRPTLALFQNILSVVMCALLNYVFVLQMHLGVEGSALATVLGECVGMVFVLGYFCLNKNAAFKLRFKCLTPDFLLQGRILIMGLASFAMSLASTVICVVFNWVVGHYGSLTELGAQGALASIGVAQKVTTFAFTPMIGVAMGAQPIIGYNFGAKNWDRVHRALKLAITTGVAIGAIFLALSYLFPSQIVSIFGINNELSEFSQTCLKIYIIFFPLVGFHAVGGSYFQSSGQPIKSAILELTRQIIFLIPFYLTLPQLLLHFGIVENGLIGAVLCPPTADFCSAIVTIIFVLIEMKRLRGWIKNPAKADEYLAQHNSAEKAANKTAEKLQKN